MVPTSQNIFSGSYAPAAPSDMIAGLGKNGQIVSISKSKGLVLIRMGNQVNSGEVPTQFCNSIWEKLNAVMCNNTSINDSGSNTKSISIYPNPANTEINFDLPSNDDIQVEISDAMGRLIIKEQNKNKIDISNLINGLYFILVKQGERSYTQKLIKQ
jgi:hypothetical protein